MSMQDISDKELDQFFSNSTEDPNIPFEENAWAKMEQSLNKHYQQQRNRRYRLTALVVLAVYFLSTVSVRTLEYSSGTSAYSSSSEKNNTASLSTGTAVHSVEEKRTAAKTVTNTQEALHDEIAVPSAVGKKEIVRALQQESILEKEKEKGKQRNVNRPVYYKSDKQTPTHKHNKGDNELALSDHSTPSNALTPEINAETHETEINPTNNASLLSEAIILVLTSTEPSTLSTVPATIKITGRADGIVNTDNNQSTDNSLLVLAQDSVKKTLPADSLLPVVAQTTTDSTHKKDKSPLKRRFSLGIFASPDFSFTSSMQFVAPGVSAGIFAEYHINHRWAIFAGVMRSSKVYSSAGSDYNATDKYWAYKGYTSRIDGSCAVLDVPLNVKYHFYNRNKNLLFASAGVSSYFMLHEKYSFVYSDGSAERSWAYTNKESYFFGLLNLSAGYERYIGKSFSVQVEPFVKIPLNTIGEGQVKLVTTGTFFHLKYSIH